ncbi:MAG: radical SAM protein [Lachnospiraceae bacterium]|nr:radical SAM protein [Lachnospiraceae bacterium]
MKKEKILITNIQRFSLHDGPGIRTTVFLKGCSLHCPWCSNPENISSEFQQYHKDGKTGVFGRYIGVDELLTELLKDRVFYGEFDRAKTGMIDYPGGVTFSGGEPLLQIDRLEPVCMRLHENSISIAVETALFVDEKKIKKACELVDIFYVDVKILNPERAKKIVGGDIGNYLRNLDFLMNYEERKNVVVRIPFIGGFTDDSDNQEKVLDLLDRYKDRISMVEILPEHDLGRSKYEALGIESPRIICYDVSKVWITWYLKKIDELGIRAELCVI